MSKATKRRCEGPGCNSVLLPHRRRFCCNSCKDKYHNLHNPRGKFAHLAESQKERNQNGIYRGYKSDYYRENDGSEDDVHPFDSYSLGQD